MAASADQGAWENLAQRVVACNRAGKPTSDEVGEKFAVRVRGRCKALLSRRLRHEDAEELTQHIVVKAWRLLPGFRGEFGGRSLCAFVETAITNELRTFLRKKAELREVSVTEVIGRMQAEDEDAEALLEKGQPLGVLPAAADSWLAARDLKERLVARIAQLPSGQKRAFHLHHLLGFSFRDVGRLLGVSEKAAKMSGSRAYQVLQQVVAAYENGE